MQAALSCVASCGETPPHSDGGGVGCERGVEPAGPTCCTLLDMNPRTETTHPTTHTNTELTPGDHTHMEHMSPRPEPTPPSFTHGIRLHSPNPKTSSSTRTKACHHTHTGGADRNHMAHGTMRLKNNAQARTPVPGTSKTMPKPGLQPRGQRTK